MKLADILPELRETFTEADGARIIGEIYALHKNPIFRLLNLRDDGIRDFMLYAPPIMIKGALAVADQQGNHLLHHVVRTFLEYEGNDISRLTTFLEKIEPQDLDGAVIRTNHDGLNPFHIAAVTRKYSKNFIIECLFRKASAEATRTALRARTFRQSKIVIKEVNDDYYILNEASSPYLINEFNIPENETPLQLLLREYETNPFNDRDPRVMIKALVRRLGVDYLKECMRDNQGAVWLTVAKTSVWVVDALLLEGIDRGVPVSAVEKAESSNKPLAVKLEVARLLEFNEPRIFDEAHGVLKVLYAMLFRDESVDFPNREQVKRLRAADLRAVYENAKPFLPKEWQFKLLRMELESYLETMHERLSFDDYDLIIKERLAKVNNAAYAIFSVASGGEGSQGHQAVIKQDAELGRIFNAFLSIASEQQARAFQLVNTIAVGEKDTKGLTRLHYAAKNGDIGAVKSLLEQRVEISATDKDGWTSLHYAANEGHAKVVDILLNAGASVKAAHIYTKSVLTVAAKHPEIRAKLELAALIESFREKKQKTLTRMQAAPAVSVLGKFRASPESLLKEMQTITANLNAAEEILDVVLNGGVHYADTSLTQATSKELLALCKQLAVMPCGANLDPMAFEQLVSEKELNAQVNRTSASSVNGA